jgi:hypothetical protein
MLCIELTNGTQLEFETPEALARAVEQICCGTPLIVRDERDGSKQVLWAPDDQE